MKNSIILLLSIALIACKTDSEIDTTSEKQTDDIITNSVDESIAVDSIDNNTETEEKNLSPVFSDFVVSDYPFDVVEAYIWDETNEPTNIRATPGGEVISQLVEGDYMLQIVDKKDKWFKVEYIDTPDNSIIFPDYEGWIHSSVIGMATRNYGNQPVNIYSEASETSETVYILQNETQVKLADYLSENGKIDWIKVSFKSEGKSISGWIKKEWLCGNPLTTCS